MSTSPDEIDAALVAACFRQIAAQGWARLSIPLAAHEAGIALDIARTRLPTRYDLLRRFGAMADAAALKGAVAEGPVRDRLFDLVMRRIDVLQTHRDGVRALLRAIPFDPAAALLLARANLCSMDWCLAAAGLPARPHAAGLMAVWAWTVRAWDRDDSEDLAATMAALDRALDRAEQVAGRFARSSPPQEPAHAE